jgi:hypothetical protein
MLGRSIGVKSSWNGTDLMGRVQKMGDSILYLYNEMENVRV